MFSRQKREAGVVLDRSPGQFGGSRIRKFHVDVVPYIAHGVSADEVLDLAHKVDRRMLGPAALGQRKLAAGNLHRDRNEVLGAIELEMIDLGAAAIIKARRVAFSLMTSASFTKVIISRMPVFLCTPEAQKLCDYNTRLGISPGAGLCS